MTHDPPMLGIMDDQGGGTQALHVHAHEVNQVTGAFDYGAGRQGQLDDASHSERLVKFSPLVKHCSCSVT